jgi:glutaminase
LRKGRFSRIIKEREPYAPGKEENMQYRQIDEEFERVYYGDDEALMKVLSDAYIMGLKQTPTGKVADYIPELSKANRDSFGIYLLKNDGQAFSCGDVTTRYTMQSISKVAVLAFALTNLGFDEVFSHVLMEPTGDSFNSIIKLDTRSPLPFNPLINAGAIEVISLLVDKYSYDDILAFVRRMCMDDEIVLNEAVYRSEFETGDRNRAIAYLLKSKKVLAAEPDETLDLYFRLCSLNVTAKSLAGLGSILANDGEDIFTGKRLIHPSYVRTINSLMYTCGMYDGSGEFGVRVGVPAKSGVGGGIACGVKGRMGIGIYGPSLDEKGNSVAGLSALEYISKRLRLNVFDYAVYPEE